jgi:hypothetical protein
MIKSVILIGTLALAGIASAKSYDFTLGAPVKVGKSQLPAGQYQVKVVGGNFAVFTNLDNGRKYLTSVKVQDFGTKFDQTAVELKTKDGAEQITGVELEGSNSMIELGE